MSINQIGSYAAGSAFALALVLAPFADATTINFATGQDGSGSIQTAGDSLDANWKLDLSSPGNTPKLFPNAYVVGSTSADGAFFAWVANGPNSSWVAPNPDSATANGNFTIDYFFNLAGDDLSSAAFHNTQWAIDDQGKVVLNGHVEGTLGPGMYGTLNPITLNPADLVAGLNELQVVGVLADNLFEASRFEGTLTINPLAAIPEPASLAIFGTALAGLGVIRRRRRRAL